MMGGSDDDEAELKEDWELDGKAATFFFVFVFFFFVKRTRTL